MDTIKEAEALIVDKMQQQQVIKVIFSNPNKKNQLYHKIVLENKSGAETFFYQYAYFYDTKVKHENVNEQGMLCLGEKLTMGFKQVDVLCSDETIHLLINKKMGCKILVERHTTEKRQISTTHNRIKNYLLQEGTPIPWLVHLGIMTQEGNVIQKMQKKFRQLNRFLEFIDDIHKEIQLNDLILDFGCGKSYLTFATYYYFHEIRQCPVQMVGMDLKADVVAYCNDLVDKFGFSKLRFICGDIQYYQPTQKIKMVLTLHACDTATDYALYHGILWDSAVILSVPCCQHELNGQIKNEMLAPLLKYGVLKERFAALLTDACRGQLLEIFGYRTQVMEFIDMEHTPKNIMIRAVKGTVENKQERYEQFLAMQAELNIEPMLYTLLKERLAEMDLE